MADVAGISGDYLKQYIERIERLEEEKAGIASDISDVYSEAKGNGFDIKIMRQIIRLRKMSAADREEHEALLDIYKASLGMLDGTPLGEYAVRKLSGKRPKSEEGSQEDFIDEQEKTPEQKQNPATIEQAREMAKQAALEGSPVTDNPFTARDPRRSAWDEEWCKTHGSDGMELPEAWRRKSKKDKKGEK